MVITIAHLLGHQRGRNNMTYHFMYSPEKNYSNRNDGVFMIDLPVGIHDRDVLFDEYCLRGKFSAGFGRNWDALYDSLCDLSWLNSKKVVISHKDVPLLQSGKQAEVYIKILNDVVKSWQNNPVSKYYDSEGVLKEKLRSVEVVFPEEYRGIIEKMA